MAYKISTNAMKKLTIMMLLAAFFTLCVTSCSKDDDDSFAYPMEQLYGKWKAVEIKVDGRWYDVTKYPYTKTITTYVSGKEYAVYTVNSLNGNEADLTLRMGSETLQMKAKKQY